MEATFETIFQGIVEGQAKAVRQGVEENLAAGVDPAALLNQAMIPAMAEVGRLFEIGDYYIPDMLISARAMQAGLAALKPSLLQAGITPMAKVVAGTVEGDYHDIGKNLVCMMLEGAAFEIIDLGANVPPDKFVDAVRSHNAQVVVLSALLTTTMVNMKATIEALQVAGLRDKVKVMVGGAPLTEAYARQIGADGYAPDASRAVVAAKNLLGIGAS
jgi:5-methyltetrahydrofolate--homocysteine methyltransferase